jgi:hypothetical protein
MTKFLITSALPYINGAKHLGNLVGSLLPADVRTHDSGGRSATRYCSFAARTSTERPPSSARSPLDRVFESSVMSSTPSKRISIGDFDCRSTISDERRRTRIAN